MNKKYLNGLFIIVFIILIVIFVVLIDRETNTQNNKSNEKSPIIIPGEDVNSDSDDDTVQNKNYDIYDEVIKKEPQPNSYSVSRVTDASIATFYYNHFKKQLLLGNKEMIKKIIKNIPSNFDINNMKAIEKYSLNGDYLQIIDDNYEYTFRIYNVLDYSVRIVEKVLDKTEEEI